LKSLSRMMAGRVAQETQIMVSNTTFTASPHYRSVDIRVRDAPDSEFLAHALALGFPSLLLQKFESLSQALKLTW